MRSRTPKPIHDHIFGDMDLPENSANWLIKHFQGIRHYNQKTPRNPKPGETVNLLVTSSNDFAVEAVYLWATIDDWETQTEYSFSKHKVTWCTAIWSYLQEWTLTLPPQPEGSMLRYKIGAKQEGLHTWLFADSQAGSFDLGSHYSIWYGGSAGPKWAKYAITYQIFMDRFNPGGGKSWREGLDLRQPFGGTVKGVTEKLPFIKSMGFNTIWLTPIYQSPSHHGYDISDYYQVNPRLGTLDDFSELIETAHQNQMKLILDFVANHCSNEHIFFQDAIENRHSPYHDYFVWKAWPQYECFYNVRKMPKLNLAYGGPARQYLLDVAQYWLNLGVDGFRLDNAHGPEQDFWVDFRRACWEVNPDHWTFAEIVQPADVQATYAGGVGGSLDFLLCQALRLTFGQQAWPLSKFAGFLQSHFNYFPEDFRLPSFLDNHDMNRFLVAANGDERLLRLALLVLFALPGPPIIYYGTEVPMNQNRSIHAEDAQGFDEARLPLPWEAQDGFTLTGYLARLAEIRSSNPNIWQTGWHIRHSDDLKGLLILDKAERGDHLLLINHSGKKTLNSIKINGENQFIDLVNGKIYPCVDGSLPISLEPFSGMLITSISE